MIQIVQAAVTQVMEEYDDLQTIAVLCRDEVAKAINYPALTGKVVVGDLVWLNTTAVDLELGTGGCHFVVHGPHARLPSDAIRVDQHIMKLRYTPLQIATGACEEEASPYHDLFLEHDSIDGMPVLVAELHSMLPILVAYIKHHRPAYRIAYIMTDHGALPLAFSRHVRTLKDMGWLEGTITSGHAFGGDLECVNIYTALLAAKHIVKADLTIVAMGPGIVGTATPLGFTGMDQTHTLHAVHSLGGLPILVPRIGAADERERHNGISSHTQDVLRHTLVPVHVPLLTELGEQLESNRHFVHYKQQEALPDLAPLFAMYPHRVETMGRGLAQDPLFFYATVAAADFAVEEIEKRRDEDE